MNKPLCLILLVAIHLVAGIGCATQKTPTAAGTKPPALAGDLKKRIAVVDFIDKTEYGKGRLASATVDILEGELQRTEKFLLVGHSSLDEVLNIQALGQSGAVDADTAVKAGKLVGANAIINGSVSEFGIKKSSMRIPGVIGQNTLEARAVVDINLIDATTGLILLSESAEGTAESSSTKVLNVGTDNSYDETLAGKALREAIASLTEKIIARMSAIPWQGYIIENGDNGIFITGGKDAGLTEGMTLDLVTPSKKVNAPDGRTYELPGGMVGRIKVVRVLPDISEVRMVEGQAPKDVLVRSPN